LPVRRPRPSGEYANIVTPSSRAAVKTAIFGSSLSKVNGEYSTWIADIGWTLCARRRVSPVHSQIPMYLTLPSLQRFSFYGGRIVKESPTLQALPMRQPCVRWERLDPPLLLTASDVQLMCNWSWMRTCAHNTNLSGQHRVSRETFDRLL
jgi:hypothetical protein